MSNPQFTLLVKRLMSCYRRYHSLDAVKDSDLKVECFAKLVKLEQKVYDAVVNEPLVVESGLNG